MANKKPVFPGNGSPAKKKRGRPPKNSTPLNIELTDQYPDEKDREYYRKRYDQYRFDFPDLNSSSDMNIVNQVISQEILQMKLTKVMNDPEHPENLRDKEIVERVEKIQTSVPKLLETLKARRSDRDTHGKEDSFSILEFAERLDLNARKETHELQKAEEIELLKKKAGKSKVPDAQEKPQEEEKSMEVKPEENNGQA